LRRSFFLKVRWHTFYLVYYLDTLELVYTRSTNVSTTGKLDRCICRVFSVLEGP
jgi:hypothetical protein